MRKACLDIVQALQAPHEVTVSSLLKEYDLDASNLLDAYSQIDLILADWNVCFDPPIGSGGPDDLRVLRTFKQSDLTRIVQQEIALGEGQTIEFKQTLAMDVKKHELGKKELKDCFSDEVVLSCLKSIAGFLNGEGGTLLVGVRDDRLITSVEREFVCTCPKDNLSLDGWELRLRGLIEQYFIDGSVIQPYVQVDFCEIDGLSVARIKVGSREKISFISKGGSDVLYLRIGNRTQSVLYRDVEHFFEMTRRV